MPRHLRASRGRERNPPPTPPPPPARGRERNTPPPPPLPKLEPGADLINDGEPEEPGLFYVRKAINASEWEAGLANDASKPTHQVLVSGLPDHLLSDSMFEAILDASAMPKKVRSFKASRDKHAKHGQVLITLDSADDAWQMACHFHNRQWGAAVVAAEVLPTWDTEESEEPEWELPSNDLIMSTRLQPDVPECVPSFAKTVPAQCPPQSGKSWLEEATVSLGKERHVSSSDVSTRDGESESGDESSRVGSIGAYSPGQTI